MREDDIMNQEDKKTQALRAALEYRQLQIELNPQILQNVFKATGLKPEEPADLVTFWQRLIGSIQQFLSFLWKRKVRIAFATSILVVVVVLFQIIPPEPEPILKGSPLAPQELVVSNPQVTAQTLKADLAKLGIIATVKVHDESWMVEVTDLSTDNPQALFVLLKEYQLELPQPGENSLKVRVVAKDNF